MAQYGDVIDSGFDPMKDSIYGCFVQYFNNPTLVKIKDVDVYSVYMIKIHALLGNAYRYLILFVDADKKTVGSKVEMDQLKWVSLQTRTLEEYHNIPTHSYTVVNSGPLTQRITLKDRDDVKTDYKVESLPLTVTLLNTKKSSSFQYSSTGSIIVALETYQTIICFV